MIRLAVVGIGKMGLSHHAMINAHPEVKVEAICDSASFMLDVLGKYTGVRTFTSFDAMLREVALDAVIIATPSSQHGMMVKAALDRGLHVFCEKPFCLDPAEGESLADLAHTKGVVNQVGYHNRFVGTFGEVKRLLDANAIGEVSHLLAEAYGPVVLRAPGTTWRTRRNEGGGCLYDYAAHPINLVNWYCGAATGVGGTVLNRLFSTETEDEVVGTLHFSGGKCAQVSVNWSDASHRKMSTSITIWGSAGRIRADGQECAVYLRDTARVPANYRPGWNTRYVTDLTAPVWFYLRGEEYASQLEHFVDCIQGRCAENLNSFASAVTTDRVLAMMVADAARGPAVNSSHAPHAASERKKHSLFGRAGR
jgi:predicted dehydrogenase